MMDRDAYARWLFDTQCLENELNRIEQVEHALLDSLHCPTDPVAIDAILNGERPEPWPKRTSARDRRRARYAMFALAFVQQTRSHIGLTDGNPQRAAYAALMAGAFAGDIVAHAEGIALSQSRHRGGHTTGEKIAAKATKHDALIAKLYRRWAMSDELQDKYRSPVTYIAKESGLHVRTIQRALKRLKKAQELATVA
jgi:hypothetical protein